MLTKFLQSILFVLIISVLISGNILVKEMREAIPEIDYTIYDVRESKTWRQSGNDTPSPLLHELIDSFKEDSRERKYKYYKKLELVNYCNCDECRTEWVWTDPPKWKRLTSGVSIAANPNTLTIGTHIRIGDKEMVVHYNDESIPSNKIYVYIDKHTRNAKSEYLGIYDVYKEK